MKKTIPVPFLLLKSTVITIFMSVCFYIPAVSQTKIYASSQTVEQVSGCGSCQVLNPQGSVGSNENDYATIVINTSALGGSITQLLGFPQMQTAPFSKIVVGLGRGKGFSLKLLGRVSIATFQGANINGDSRTIDSTSIGYNADSTRFTYTFFTTKNFDHVGIELNGGLLSLGDSLRIYYAYYQTLPTNHCTTPPPNPLAYYPLDLNTNDVSPNRFNAVNHRLAYTDNAICKIAVADTSLTNAALTMPTLPRKSEEFTIAYWTKSIHDGSSIEIIYDYWLIQQRSDNNKIATAVIYQPPVTGHHVVIPDAAAPPPNADKYYHTVLTFKNDVMSYYLNGSLRLNGDRPPKDSFEIPVMASVTLNKQYLDDLVFYDRALTDQEVATYWSSYQVPDSTGQLLSNIHPVGLTAGVKKKQSLQLYPNPTTGLIIIKTKLDPGSNLITLTDISGKEVFKINTANPVINLPSSVSSGNYILQVMTKDGKIYKEKVVIHRN
ncbi:Por secretion system C-terminal sorting domain-containing protein [Chitinophaga eiseniae]|uniref:Por secretion system C-terminal sorting domain-containing protein n=1 Tax=Chitinophaga eiseniae TaxID=634771 RepID=A0A1T4QQI2_9BACT|nr:T9SS type A sorting domain-containing protein [Chitinophaga eiseniae]SKA05934.1 Por secretion system C-terminal sorting domain-containing protein [Chitinophaga eiseniae]